MNITKIAQTHPELFVIIKHRPVMDFLTLRSCFELKTSIDMEFKEGYIVYRIDAIEPFGESMINEIGSDPCYLFLTEQDAEEGWLMEQDDWLRMKVNNELK